MEETTNHKFSLISAVNLGLIRLLKIVLLFMTLKLIKAERYILRGSQSIYILWDATISKESNKKSQYESWGHIKSKLFHQI